MTETDILAIIKAHTVEGSLVKPGWREGLAHELFDYMKAWRGPEADA